MWTNDFAPPSGLAAPFQRDRRTESPQQWGLFL